MKTVIITQEELLYLPLFMGRVLKEHQKTAAVILLPSVPRVLSGTYVRRLYGLFGLGGFIIYGILFVYYAFLNLLSHWIRFRRFYSVSAAARSNSIPVYRLKDINASEAIDLLKRIEPELIISVAAPQVFGREVIHSARFAINIHAALLPEYRGMMPSFWVLAKNEAETGITVHFIDEHIDSGDIILQRVIAISPEDTLHSLQTKVAHTGASALLESLSRIENSGVTTTEPRGEGSYYSFPTKEAAKELRARGRRVI